MTQNSTSSSIVSSLITGFVAAQAIAYAEKVIGVLLLAMVTELGRRFIGWAIARLGKKKS